MFHSFKPNRHIKRAARLLLALSLIALGLRTALPHRYGNLFAPTAQAAGFIVNSTGDGADANTADNICDSDAATLGEQCTLRAAIQQANATSGADTIGFNIPASDPNCNATTHVCTITPASALPTIITDSVIIDGYTQPGSSANTMAVGNNAVHLIELNGNGAAFAGLTITAGNSTVRGLVINRFSGNGPGNGVTLLTNGGNHVEGCFIGLDAGGATDLSNSRVGIEIESASNTIGGATPQARNVIIGAGGAIYAPFGNAGGNTIQGNYIGTNAAGTAGLSTNSSVGFLTPSNTLGGTAPGAGNVISSNIGISFDGLNGNSNGNQVQGNFIGISADGTTALSNNGGGITLSRSTTNTIGGTSAAARNVISVNGHGVNLIGASSGNTIQGNYIGTNAAGTTRAVTGFMGLGAAGSGVRVEGGTNNLIGGATAGAANVIANHQRGVALTSAASGNMVQGNFIGTNAAGTAEIPNNGGIAIVTPQGSQTTTTNTIGGTTAAARNVISGNFEFGISLSGADGNTIQGNFIGVAADGTTALGNHGRGIESSGGNNNLIGGTTAGASNVIAFNGSVAQDRGSGVRVFDGTGNAIRGNSIFSNGNPNFPTSDRGIALGGGAIPLNENCDPDTGANNLQNFPVITSAMSSAGSTTITGTLNSTASTTFTLEFFANTVCSPSGNGEGRTFLGSTQVTTDGSCNANINAVLPVSVAAGQVVTATATDPGGNTSEFSACAQILVPTQVQLSAANYNGTEGCLAVQLTVTRTGSSTGQVAVDFATSDGGAQQRTDYTIGSGTVTLAAGETSKTFPVLINEDNYQDPGEQLSVTLSNLTGNATLGTPSVATVTILDNDSSPPTSNIIDDAGDFVCQHYHDFLSREPDADGFAFWVSQITQCGNDQACIRRKRIDVSNAFFFELEFQQTGAYVYRLYRAAYGNTQPFSNPNADTNPPGAIRALHLPSYAVFARDRARVVGGSDLALGQQALANVFVGRPEFLAKYAANLDGSSFIDAVLATIKNDIGVDLTSQKAGLLTLFNSGGRTAVMYRLADDSAQTNPINNRAFIDAEYNRAFVTTQYFGYLRRDADLSGINFWFGQVNSGPLRDVPKQHAMVCSFITSAEYQQRFSSVVTRTNAECPQ